MLSLGYVSLCALRFRLETAIYIQIALKNYFYIFQLFMSLLTLSRCRTLYGRSGSRDCIADFFVVFVTGPVSLVEGEDFQCSDYERESDWDYGHYLATKDAAKGTESAPSFLSSDLYSIAIIYAKDWHLCSSAYALSRYVPPMFSKLFETGSRCPLFRL